MLVSSTLHNQQIVNSLIPQEFSEFIKEKMNERESKYVEKRNMKLEVLPEFHQLFEETTTISSKKFWASFIGSRGRFHQLVRNTGAKREKRDAMRNQRYEEDKGVDDLLEEKN